MAPSHRNVWRFERFFTIFYLPYHHGHSEKNLTQYKTLEKHKNTESRAVRSYVSVNRGEVLKICCTSSSISVMFLILYVNNSFLRSLWFRLVWMDIILFCISFCPQWHQMFRIWIIQDWDTPLKTETPPPACITHMLWILSNSVSHFSIKFSSEYSP